MIRFLDIVFSLLGLIVLSSLFLLLAAWIKVDSSGPVMYIQNRVGKDGIKFGLYKFRSMYINADNLGLLTIGRKDPRITKSGRIIRAYKLDELPQLINVLMGDMSLVGPRPEVHKYVDLYTEEQKKVLKVRPGITDLASIVYSSENEMLKSSVDPEKFYIEHIMPDKIRLNMKFIDHPGVIPYFRILFKTLSNLVNQKFRQKEEKV